LPGHWWSPAWSSPTSNDTNRFLRSGTIRSSGTIVGFSLASVTATPDTVVVTTKVSTELGDLSGLLLDEAALIAPEIVRAKEIAKHAFFGLTTEATRTRLGARYAAS
jgi:hypothetical protein